MSECCLITLSLFFKIYTKQGNISPSHPHSPRHSSSNPPPKTTKIYRIKKKPVVRKQQVGQMLSNQIFQLLNIDFSTVFLNTIFTRFCLSGVWSSNKNFGVGKLNGFFKIFGGLRGEGVFSMGIIIWIKQFFLNGCGRRLSGELKISTDASLLTPT